MEKLGRGCHRRIIVAVLSAMTLLVLAGTPSAMAACTATSSVINNADSGAGSLRQAIIDTCAGGTITFGSGLSGGTITLSSTLALNQNVTIDGTGLASQLSVSGNSSVNPFTIDNYAVVTLKDLTLKNGFNSFGGAIFLNTGSLTVEDCYFTNNSATYDGGAIEVWNNATALTVKRCTFIGNNAQYGAAIRTNHAGTTTIENSTFYNNASGQSGTIDNRNGSCTLNLRDNTITSSFTSLSNYGSLSLWNNIITNGCYSSTVPAVNLNNLVTVNNGNCPGLLGTDPKLNTPANYGGRTMTMALQTGSPAIDAADDGSSLSIDQRGTARPQGAHSDIGAFELEPAKFTVTANATGTGRGTVSSNTGSINYTYPAAITGTTSTLDVGTSVTLTAAAAPGMIASWTTCGGATAGNGTASATCTYSSLDGNKNVQASFLPLTVGNALNFDGVGDYVEIPRSVQDDFTIEYWVNTTQTGGDGSDWFYGAGLVDAEVSGVVTDFGTSLMGSKVGFGLVDWNSTIKSTTSINDGVWHHVAAVRNKTTGEIKLYVDGNLENSAFRSTASLTAASRITIGMIQTGFNYFNGTIDDLRIWNVVRSQAEIRANRNTALAPTTPGLVAYYRMDQGIPGGNNTVISTLTDATNLYPGTLYNLTRNGSTSNFVSGALPEYSYSVTANATGNGSGMVKSDTGGINYNYPPTTNGSTTELVSGSAVTLTATANTGSTVSWTACGGTAGGTSTAATCSYTSLLSDQAAQATFSLNQYAVTANVPGGNGSVTSTNPVATTHGTTTTFTVSPAADYQKDTTVGGTCPVGSWNGNDYTTGVITSACGIQFAFTKITYPVTIAFAGAGWDKVAVSANPPAGSDCTGNCSQSFDIHTDLTLTPSALTGYGFLGWSGDCSGTGACSFSNLTSGKSATATFAQRCLPIAQIIAPVASSTGSYNVSWSASTPGATYTLYEGGVAVPACTNISSNYCSFTGKVNGTYNYTVKASKGGYADSLTAGPASTVVTLACAPIATLTVPTTSSTGKYTVSWGISTLGSSYTLFEGGVAVPACTNISTTTCALTGKGNGTYSYTVQASKSGYTSSPVKGPASITVTLACTPIATITVPATSSTGSYRVSWGASTPGSTYSLYENGSPTPIYSGTATSYAVSGRLSGSYTYSVKAKQTGYLDSPLKISGAVVVIIP